MDKPNIGEVIVSIKENLQNLGIKFDRIKAKDDELIVIISSESAQKLWPNETKKGEAKVYSGHLDEVLDELYRDISNNLSLAFSRYQNHGIVEEFNFSREGFDCCAEVKMASGETLDGSIGTVFTRFKETLFPSKSLTAENT